MQAIFRTNLTQIAQLKESVSNHYQNYDARELTKIQKNWQSFNKWGEQYNGEKKPFDRNDCDIMFSSFFNLLGSTPAVDRAHC